MDPAEYSVLARRLIDNAHDLDALAAARRMGMADPATYALLLEKVAHGTEDRRNASHWFVEAAAVWSTTLRDERRAEAALREAIRTDPWNERAAERLAHTLDGAGRHDAVLVALEKRAMVCASRIGEVPNGSERLAAMWVELGRRWSAGQGGRVDRALVSYERAFSLDPKNLDAIRGVRAMHLRAGRWPEVIATFEKERMLLRDRSEQITSLREEASVRKTAGDRAGMVQALRLAHLLDEDDLDLAEDLANSILARITGGDVVSREERAEAALLFVSLAETYDGEIALSHALNALRANPSEDGAIGLAGKLAASMHHEAMMVPFWVAYLGTNPKGRHATSIRLALAKAHEESGRTEEALKVLLPIEKDNEDASAKVMSLIQRAGRVDDLVERLDAQAATLSPAARFDVLLESARLLSKHERVDGAAQRYLQVLSLHPAQPEAVEHVTAWMRGKGQKGPLRDVLVTAARHASTKPEGRRAMLREAGELSHELGDLEQARELLTEVYEANRNDEAVRGQLKRVLGESGRWDDVIRILDREIGSARSGEGLVGLLRELAEIQEHKRGDAVQAANTWSRIAKLSPNDESTLMHAVELYEKGDRLDQADMLLAGAIERMEAEEPRAKAYSRLALIREKLGNHAEAAEASAARARLTGAAEDWVSAERHAAAAQRWTDAVAAIRELVRLEESPSGKATLHVRMARHLANAGEHDDAVAALEHACELDPGCEPHWSELERACEDRQLLRRFVETASRVSQGLADKPLRVTLRRQAARVLGERLGDGAGAIAVLRLLLEDEEDPDALERVADDAERAGRHKEAAALLERLEARVTEPADRLRLLLRLARMRASALDDSDGALAILDRVLRDVDPSCNEAIELSVDLLTSRGDWLGVAAILERARAAATDPERELALVLRLAAVAEERLDDASRTAEYLQQARKLAPSDFGILRRLAALLESSALWEQLSEVLAAMVQHAHDLDELSSLAIRRATVLEQRLGRVQDALGALVELADLGDKSCRIAYVRIADDASRKDLAALRLERWSTGDDGSERDVDGLVAAFDRFLQSRLLQDASRVAGRLRGSVDVGRQVAHRLEEGALKAGDLEVVRTAQGYLLEGRSGREAAEEAVRQAEVLVGAGADRAQAVVAAETLFQSIEPRDARVFVPRLAALAPSPEDRLAIYERQVARSVHKDERLSALAEAAMVAARLKLNARCRRLFALGISTSTNDVDLVGLERTASQADEELGGTSVRRVWAEALAEGASQARGGELRQAALLRKAALIAHRELHDPGLGFDWANESLLIRLTAAVQGAFREHAEQMSKLSEAVDRLARRVAVADLPSALTRSSTPPPPEPSMSAAAPEAEDASPAFAPERASQGEGGIPVLVDLTGESADDDAEYSQPTVTIEGPMPFRMRADTEPSEEPTEQTGAHASQIAEDAARRRLTDARSSPSLSVEEVPVTMDVMEALMSIGEHLEPKGVGGAAGSEEEREGKGEG